MPLRIVPTSEATGQSIPVEHNLHSPASVMREEFVAEGNPDDAAPTAAALRPSECERPDLIGQRAVKI